MIIRQTTTIVFEYPQDYLQEQEWCKTKEDRWVHKGTDTLCSVYENQISYSIGASVKIQTERDEPQTDLVNDSQVLAKDLVDDEFNPYDEECMRCKHLKLRCELVPSYCKYEPRDEPQADCTTCDQVGRCGRGIVHMCHCENCGAEIEYMIPIPETDCQWA